MDTADDARLAAARAEFAPTVTYLNTPSIGLPPRRTVDAIAVAMREWQDGAAAAPDYDRHVDRARRSYAQFVGVPTERVAIGSQASALAGLVAAAVRPGQRVVVAQNDFTSVVFPFLAQVARGVRVDEVPPSRIVDAVADGAAWVAVSAVQSRDGTVLDLDALARACATGGVRSLIDLTQAVGWLPIDAGRWDVTVASAYKWLLAPRGAAYLTLREDLQDDLIPHAAGWYAGDQPWRSIYGSPLRLATDARRFDVSPAWLSWVGAAESQDLLHAVGRELLHHNAVGLANRFRRGVGLPDGNSAIVSLDTLPGADLQLAAAGVVGAVQDGRLRLGFHVSTTEADVDRAIEALDGRLRRD